VITLFFPLFCTYSYLRTPNPSCAHSQAGARESLPVRLILKAVLLKGWTPPFPPSLVYNVMHAEPILSTHTKPILCTFTGGCAGEPACRLPLKAALCDHPLFPPLLYIPIITHAKLILCTFTGRCAGEPACRLPLKAALCDNPRFPPLLYIPIFTHAKFILCTFTGRCAREPACRLPLKAALCDHPLFPPLLYKPIFTHAKPILCTFTGGCAGKPACEIIPESSVAKGLDTPFSPLSCI